MTLAAIKRSLTVGTRVTITHHGEHGPGDTFPWGNGTRTLPFTREVAVQQSNAVAFAEPNDGKSWTYFPKASEVTINDDGSWTYNGLTYRLAD